ncbi:MAG: pantetheine-phosphate adenylyltransferase [Oscillospiraceae bacterium]|nr:pantetheine-phosphate adenylyltransferase [Oscillospiraceae bacterium]
MNIAICPGSFDPITVGHLDLAERSAAIFERVILCVMVNGEKHPMFSLEERLELARAAVAHLPNVEAQACSGLLADFAREHGAHTLIKGVRGSADFDWEMQMVQINRDLFPQLDTILLPARPEHMHISSTMVREFLRYRQALDRYVPAGAVRVLQRIREGKV